MTNALVQARLTSALQFIYVADALSMPVHWFYVPQNIIDIFPQGIQTFEDAPAKHPHDFLSLPATKGKQIVGDVILKGKKQFWNIPNQHVHQGMKAGENTLNAHCARLVTRVITKNAGHYDGQQFLDAYITFMTADTPQHPDTYAEAYHRGFFTNLEAGAPPQHCGLAAESTASIGGLVTIAPIAIAELLQDRDVPRVQKICREHLYFTHPDKKLGDICDAYVQLIDVLLFRSETASAQDLIAATASSTEGIDVKEMAAKYTDDNEVIGKLYGKSCGIENSWPGVLYLAYKYNQHPIAGLLANTNVGGENCHRGSVLGVILGLSSAQDHSEFFDALTDSSAIKKEINEFIVSCNTH